MKESIYKGIKKFIKGLFYFLVLLISIFYIVGGGIGEREFEPLTSNLIFSHRGVPINMLENTEKSFALSKEIGFTAIETDVRITKDGIPIIFHDGECDRLLNFDGLVKNFTWDELKDKKLFFNGKETNNKIQKFSDFVQGEAYADVIYLDIKESSFSMASDLVEILEKPHSYKRILLADDNLPFMFILRLKNEKVSLIYEEFTNRKEWVYKFLPTRFRPDYYAVFFNSVKDVHYKFLKENNLIDRLIVYGVDKTNIREVENLGLPHIIWIMTMKWDRIQSFLIQKKNKLNKNEKLFIF